MLCRKALLPVGSHDSFPIQRIAAETVWELHRESARMLGRTRALMMWKIVVDLPVPGRATDAHVQFLAARWARFGATF